MSMSWKLRTVFSIFTKIDQNYPFRHLYTSAALSIPSRSSLSFYFPSPGLQISPLPAASWLGWGIRRAGAPQAFTETFSGRRWGEGSLRMRGLCGAALTTWLGHLKIRRSHSSWNGEVSPFSTGTLLFFGGTLGNELVAWVWSLGDLAAAEPAMGTSISPGILVQNWVNMKLNLVVLWVAESQPSGLFREL